MSDSHKKSAFAFFLLSLIFFILVVLEIWHSPSVFAVNNTPTVDSTTTAISSFGADQTSIDLNENSTKIIYIHGTATDQDGCGEIDGSSQWTLKAYRTNVSGTNNCTTDNNNCYASGTASLTNCTGGGTIDKTLTYQASVSLQYYSDPTDSGTYSGTNWTSYVKVVDDPGANGTRTDTWEMNSLIALNVSSSVNFGTVSLGSDSSQQTIIFTNTGNRGIDVDQSASGDMTCSVGYNNISVGNARISLTNGFSYGTGDQALTSTTSNFDLSLSARTDDSTESTKNAYLILRMPVDGVKGSCSNTVTFSAKADA